MCLVSASNRLNTRSERICGIMWACLLRSCPQSALELQLHLYTLSVTIKSVHSNFAIQIRVRVLQRTVFFKNGTYCFDSSGSDNTR